IHANDGAAPLGDQNRRGDGVEGLFPIRRRTLDFVLQPPLLRLGVTTLGDVHARGYEKWLPANIHAPGIEHVVLHLLADHEAGFHLRVTTIEYLVDLPLDVSAVVGMNEWAAGALTQKLLSSSEALHGVIPSNEPPFAVLDEEDTADGVDGRFTELLGFLQLGI